MEERTLFYNSFKQEVHISTFLIKFSILSLKIKTNKKENCIIQYSDTIFINFANIVK